MATAKKSAAGAKKAAAKKSSAKPASKSASKGAAKAPAKKAATKAPTKAPTKGVAKGGAKKAGATKTAAKKAPAAKKSTGTRKLNPALAAPMRPSAELAAVIGSDPVPRSEVAKRIWAYIHKNGLQDQQNRRNINADDRLRTVFGGKNQVSMFEMTALVNKHMTPA